MRVAIISYYSPPQPAIASHRVLRMSRVLAEQGHAVHWVTADVGRFPAAELDASLGTLIPREVEVHGIDGQALITRPVAAGFVEKVLRTLAWHLPRRFAWPDSFISWARKLRQYLPEIVRTHSIDAVVLSCSPHNQLLVLPALRRAARDLRILVDYRDLLSGNPWNVRVDPRQTRKILDLERRMLQHADVLFVNTCAAHDRFLEVVGRVGALEVEVMPNAADYDLLRHIERAAAPFDPGAGVHLGFFGVLYPRRRLRPVFEAVAEIEAARRRHLTIHVYCGGFGSKTLLEEDLAVVPADVSACVRHHEFLDYAAAVRAMQAMDALILVNGPDPSDAVFVPGKLFDYLMARRPVLFVGHAGEASDIVRATSGAEWCFEVGQTAAIARQLEKVLAGRYDDVALCDEFAPAASFAPLLNRLAAPR